MGTSGLVGSVRDSLCGHRPIGVPATLGVVGPQERETWVVTDYPKLNAAISEKIGHKEGCPEGRLDAAASEMADIALDALKDLSAEERSRRLDALEASVSDVPRQPSCTCSRPHNVLVAWVLGRELLEHLPAVRFKGYSWCPLCTKGGEKTLERWCAPPIDDARAWQMLERILKINRGSDYVVLAEGRDGICEAVHVQDDARVPGRGSLPEAVTTLFLSLAEAGLLEKP